MNEKIKEFAFECARELDWDPPTEPKTYTFTEAGIEKFAELIVQECIYLCQTTAPGRDAEDIEDAIKKHFGVEE